MNSFHLTWSPSGSQHCAAQHPACDKGECQYPSPLRTQPPSLSISHHVQSGHQGAPRHGRDAGRDQAQSGTLPPPHSWIRHSSTGDTAKSSGGLQGQPLEPAGYSALGQESPGRGPAGAERTQAQPEQSQQPGSWWRIRAARRNWPGPGWVSRSAQGRPSVLPSPLYGWNRLKPTKQSKLFQLPHQRHSLTPTAVTASVFIFVVFG